MNSCFNSRAPRGARRIHFRSSFPALGFQFTCPSRSTTEALGQSRVSLKVSIHVPLAEHDLEPLLKHCTNIVSIHVPLAEHDSGHASTKEPKRFQFTCPSRSTTRLRNHLALCFLFQFTCPSRSTTRARRPLLLPTEVSIHVPLAEHDRNSARTFHRHRVSIHVPLAEHDTKAAYLRNSGSVSIHVPLAEHDVAAGISALTFSFQFTCPSRSTT